MDNIIITQSRFFVKRVRRILPSDDKLSTLRLHFVYTQKPYGSKVVGKCRQCRHTSLYHSLSLAYMGQSRSIYLGILFAYLVVYVYTVYTSTNPDGSKLHRKNQV